MQDLHGQKATDFKVGRLLGRPVQELSQVWPQEVREGLPRLPFDPVSVQLMKQKNQT